MSQTVQLCSTTLHSSKIHATVYSYRKVSRTQPPVTEQRTSHGETSFLSNIGIRCLAHLRKRSPELSSHRLESSVAALRHPGGGVEGEWSGLRTAMDKTWSGQLFLYDTVLYCTALHWESTHFRVKFAGAGRGFPALSVRFRNETVHVWRSPLLK
jgi:hypothetical protein